MKKWNRSYAFFHTLCGERTCIYISHRLASTRLSYCMAAFCVFVEKIAAGYIVQYAQAMYQLSMEYLSVRELHRLFKHKRRYRLNGSPFLMQKSIHGSSEKYADGL